MNNKVIVGIVIIGIVLLVGFLIARIDTPTVPDEDTGEEARVIAEEWVKNMAPTFTERGGEDLVHTSTTEIDDGVFEVVLDFTSRFAGYGEVDEDEMAAQVITPHTVVVVVDGAEVVKAVTDDTFDEYNNVMLEEEREAAVNIDVYFVLVEGGQENIMAVQREAYGQNVAEQAMQKLLEGPRTEEREAGYSTAIAEGTELLSIRIEERIAYVDFSSELEVDGGSAMVMAVRDQITKTLLQFDTVDDVEIAIEGETEEILQP